MNGRLVRSALKPGRDRTALSVAALAASALLLAASAALLATRWIVLPARDSGGMVLAVRKEGSPLRDGLRAPRFTETEIEGLRALKGVQDLCPVRSAAFQTYGEVAFGGSGFGSLLFIESVPDSWLDEPFPPTQGGEGPVPVLIGESFLFIYNSAFAPSYGLPELKSAYLGLIPVSLELRGSHGTLNRNAWVAGSTALMDSILVPDNLLEDWNRRLSGAEPALPAKLLLRVEPGRAAALAEACRERGFILERNAALGTAFASFVGVAGIVLAAIAAFAALQAANQFMMGLELELHDSEPARATLILWGHDPVRLRRLVRGRIARLLSLSLGICLSCALGFAILAPTALKPWLPWPLSSAVLSLFLMHGIAFALGDWAVRRAYRHS